MGKITFAEFTASGRWYAENILSRKRGGGIRYREGWRRPEEWALDEKIKKEFLRDFERQERELEEYGTWCEEWNKWHAEKGNFGLFIEFMLAKARQPAGRRLL